MSIPTTPTTSLVSVFAEENLDKNSRCRNVSINRLYLLQSSEEIVSQIDSRFSSSQIRNGSISRCFLDISDIIEMYWILWKREAEI